MRLSTNAAGADLRNNLLFASAGGGYMAITSGRGQIQLQQNWLPTGWRDTHEAALDPGAEVSATNNTAGGAPGFIDLAGSDYGLVSGAPAADCGGEIASAAANAEGAVVWQYLQHQARRERPADGFPDAGAFEWIP